MAKKRKPETVREAAPVVDFVKLSLSTVFHFALNTPPMDGMSIGQFHDFVDAIAKDHEAAWNDGYETGRSE